MTVASLWTRHRSIALAVARDFHLPGADRDDVRQEALIALWEAAGAYRPERGPFPPFARLVVRRRLENRLSDARREKRRILTEAVRDLEDRLATVDPVDARAELRDLVAACRRLNELDRQAIARIANGVPIAGKTDDTQRFRAKRKLREAIAA